MDITIVATDGSCLESTIGPTGWAWVNQDGSFDYGGYYLGTNQVGELCAVLQALRAHHDAPNLVIRADSEYAIHSSTDWLENWKNKAKKWTNATGKQISNLPIIQAIDYEMSNRPGKVIFEWVKGHSGDKYNEQADKLCFACAQSWSAKSATGKDGQGTMPPEAFKVESLQPKIDDAENGLLF
jgi:ribonuclease HI